MMTSDTISASSISICRVNQIPSLRLIQPSTIQKTYKQSQVELQHYQTARKKINKVDGGGEKKKKRKTSIISKMNHNMKSSNNGGMGGRRCGVTAYCSPSPFLLRFLPIPPSPSPSFPPPSLLLSLTVPPLPLRLPSPCSSISASICISPGTGRVGDPTSEPECPEERRGWVAGAEPGIPR